MNKSSLKQLKIKEPFGAQAVKSGFVTPSQVLSIIEKQHIRKSQGKKHLKLGKLMLKEGIINTEQLFKIVQNSKDSLSNLFDDAIQLAVQIRSAIGNDNKSLLFTDTGDNEVSNITFQVAYAMAMMEQGKVLLLDLNFRSPSFHSLVTQDEIQQVVDQTDLPGFTNILLDGTSLEKAVHPGSIPSLFIMPTGNIAVDFLSLLLSEDFSNLLKQLCETYCVIINTPPVSVYPDTCIIAQKTDGVILVTESGAISSTALRSIKSILDGLEVEIIGVILSQP